MNDYGPVMTTPRNGMGGGYLTPYGATKPVDRSVPTHFANGQIIPPTATAKSGLGYAGNGNVASGGMGYNPINNPVYDSVKMQPYAASEPYKNPEPIVQALRQKSLNPEGIRRNANTFKGTTNAPVAPEGKTNPSGANRSAQVTSQV